MIEASKTVGPTWRRHFDIPYVQGVVLIVLGVFILLQGVDNIWIVLIAIVMFAIAIVGLIVHSLNTKAGQ